ncbi:MAG TPA: peptidylprolyl isomerase [Polyangiaceae bacterium]|nr:peptidylprolyl isomerase [Polyangiaceae bacterium]
MNHPTASLVLRQLLPVAAALALAGGATGCQRAAPAAATSAEPAPSASGTVEPMSSASVAVEPVRESLSEPYPPGRWRLSRPEELHNHLLWVSHILVRHRDVKPDSISFNTTRWAPPQAVPTRTRREAFQLARALAERAAREPQRFGDLARESSEDPATRERAGSLGGVEAAQLYYWAEVLDALAALRDGEVSRVVETEFGFHVLLRRQPPAESTVSGQIIVVGYDQAPWLHQFLARRPIPRRSHAEAQALATRIAREAKHSPEAFTRLVQRHSDHIDAARDGDFGSWSAREPSPLPSVIEVLQGLAIGQISDPLDTPFGFQIIRRTPSRSRQQLAMETIQMRADAALANADPRSVSSVSKQLREVGKTVSRFPAQFAQYQKSHCCEGREQWQEGRGLVGAELALKSAEPLRWEPVTLEPGVLALVKRVVPDASVQPTRVQLGLPEPRVPDLSYFFSETNGSSLLARFPEAAVQRLGATVDERARLEGLHGAAAKSLSDESGRDPEQVVQTLLSGVERLLGSQRNAVYLETLYDLARQRLLDPELARQINHTLDSPLGL